MAECEKGRRQALSRSRRQQASALPFAQVFVINLPYRTDRRREMGTQLARIGLGFDSPAVNLFPAVRPAAAGSFDSIGARGCFLSHLQVLRAAAGSGSVLVLEDDLDFAADIDRSLPLAMSALPATWGIFYGGCRATFEAEAAPLRRAMPAQELGESHFVAFNSHVVLPLVAYLEAILHRPAGHPEGGPMHIDGAYSIFRRNQPEIETYVAAPLLGRQRPSRTDIYGLLWFDRLPVLRQIAQVVRRVRR